MEVKIKDNFSGEVLFSAETETFKMAVELAVKKCINLSRANLIGVNLSGADLSGANLFNTNLIGANLFSTNLVGANLSGADLS